MDDLYSKSIRLKEIQRQSTNNDKDFSEKNTADKWQHILKNACDNLPNIKRIISYLLSVPATSAFTERVFSVMNVKWREERNRASINLLKNELFIYLNLDLDCNTSYQTFKDNQKLLTCAKSTTKYVFNAIKT